MTRLNKLFKVEFERGNWKRAKTTKSGKCRSNRTGLRLDKHTFFAETTILKTKTAISVILVLRRET